MFSKLSKWIKWNVVYSGLIFLAILSDSACASLSPATLSEADGPWEQVTTRGILYGPDEPSFAVAPDGTLYLAWTERSGEKSQIHVQALDGTLWKNVGTDSTGGGISDANGLGAQNPSIAIAPDGSPYVAWENVDDYAQSEIYVRTWNGSDWAEVGAGSASGGGVSHVPGRSTYPSIAIGSDGTPYVVWTEDNKSNHRISVYVRAWDGNSWMEVGPHSATGGGINHDGCGGMASMAIAPDGTPYIAWSDDSSRKDIYVRTWDGSDWVEVGEGSARGGGVSRTGEALISSMAIAPDGTPYVAWENVHDAVYDVYVRAWDGSNWVEVGAGSASSGGVSNTGHAIGPVMAVASDGIPYLAWINNGDWINLEIPNPDGPPKLYIRAWDGNEWSEVGAGSASGEGLGMATFAWPVMTVAPDGTPYIVWGSPSRLKILRYAGE